MNILFDEWGKKEEDGSYFAEIDTNIFEHFLYYLRSEVLSVFYDRLAGHDFPGYHTLLVEAKYFTMDRLEKWLCKRNIWTLSGDTISTLRRRNESLVWSKSPVTSIVARLW